MKPDLEVAERNRDAARENFLTMQRTAAQLLRRALAAEEAEAEAKDCFWSVYPIYLSLGGAPVSTETARTSLADRAVYAERENMALWALIVGNCSSEVIHLARTTLEQKP